MLHKSLMENCCPAADGSSKVPWNLIWGCQGSQTFKIIPRHYLPFIFLEILNTFYKGKEFWDEKVWNLLLQENHQKDTTLGLWCPSLWMGRRLQENCFKTLRMPQEGKISISFLSYMPVLAVDCWTATILIWTKKIRDLERDDRVELGVSSAIVGTHTLWCGKGAWFSSESLEHFSVRLQPFCQYLTQRTGIKKLQWKEAVG